MKGDMIGANLLGQSEQFKAVLKQIRRFANVGATVLISGESGTGKEQAARALHYLGERSGKPFVPVNCGSLSEGLAESELFGHERGAFTDAKSASDGLIGEADGGTLFLDEIDGLRPKAQTALLRFLQDRTYRRLGGGALRHADVRIIAATNGDLEQLSQAKQFRLDLYYRLNVLKLHMPSLRDRGDDALEMAKAFIRRLEYQYRMPAKRLHPEAVDFIRGYEWPGNIRELENVLHRDFLMSESDEIRLTEARANWTAVAQAKTLFAKTCNSFKEAKARTVAEFERSYVRELLTLTQGNLSAAARLAGKERSAFGKLARKYGIASCSHEADANEAPA
ncbi:MAG: sigma 54-interacting transcriptional regulator [Actinomycetota bacterium]